MLASEVDMLFYETDIHADVSALLPDETDFPPNVINMLPFQVNMFVDATGKLPEVNA